MSAFRPVLALAVLLGLGGCVTVAEQALLDPSDLDYPLPEGRYVYYQLTEEASCEPVANLRTLASAVTSERLYCPSATVTVSRDGTGYTMRNEQLQGPEATIAFAMMELDGFNLIEARTDGSVTYVFESPVSEADGAVVREVPEGAPRYWGVSNIPCEAWGSESTFDRLGDGSCVATSRDQLLAEFRRLQRADIRLSHDILDGPFLLLVPLQ